MSVTIKDIALDAKVSISTVSLVVNNNPLVKHETRVRVQESIERLGYIPNQYARSLITKVNKVIGVIRVYDEAKNSGTHFEQTPGNFFSEMVWALEDGITEHGYNMVIDWHNVFDQSLPKIVNRGCVDGIICVGGIVCDSFIQKLKDSGIPIVLVGARSKLVDYIDIDSEDAFYMATKHLISKGHRKISFLNGPRISQTSDRKLRGFLHAMKEAKLLPDTDCEILNCENYSGLAGYNACEKLFAKGKKPTALVVGMDAPALGVLRYLHQRKLRCPDDISVIGYEDGAFAEYAVPALTTMNIFKERLGTEACNIMFNRLGNPNARHVGIIKGSCLVERASVRSI